MLWFNITLARYRYTFIGVFLCFINMLNAHVYTKENISDSWGIPWYTIQKHCIPVRYLFYTMP